MSRTRKLLILLCLAVGTLAMISATPVDRFCTGPMKMAHTTPCVQAMEAQCNPILWRERNEIFDHGDGTMTMHFIYEPKCLTNKVPCRIASHMVAVWVDCKAKTATCM